MTNEARTFDGKAGAWENGRRENDEAEREYAMGRTWIMEDVVKTLASYLIANLMVVWAAPVFAAHWAWVEKEVAPVPWDYTAFPMFMAYDKSDQKLTLLTNDESSGTVQVWKFSLSHWIKVWEGVPSLGEISSSYHFRTVGNAYFDNNIGAIVIWGVSPGYQFETRCHALFKYIMGEGFVRITECIPVSLLGSTYPAFSIAFDTARKRAVIVGSFYLFNVEGQPFVTIEYDGTTLYYIRNNPEPPEEILFDIGTSGYDPSSNRVIFYGQRYLGYPLETWEYDGQAWTLVPPATSPPMDGYPVIGMRYIPELGGLLALPNDFGSIDSWLYRKHAWQKVFLSNQFEGRPLGMMAFDNSRQSAVFYGGIDELGFMNEMLELRCVAHCKPVSKP